MKNEYFIKIATIWADQLSRLPMIEDEKFNAFLKRSFAREKIRLATWDSLTSEKGVSCVFVEKNLTGNWILNVGEVLDYKRLNKSRLVQIRIIVNKLKNSVGSLVKQLREYNLIIENNKIKHVKIRDAVEDDMKNISYDVEKLNALFGLGLKENKGQIIEMKVIPVVLLKGHLGDGITLKMRVLDVLNNVDKFWKYLKDQAALSGAKFLINGSLVESGNLTDESQEKKLIKDLINGDNVLVYDGQLNQETPTVENIGITVMQQEFRANVDWALTKMKELSLAPDFNGGDKGTANIHGSEVSASMRIKEQHLQAWEESKKEEWDEIINIWRLRSGNKEIKEDVKELKNDIKKEQEQELKKQKNNTSKIVNKDKDKEEVEDE